MDFGAPTLIELMDTEECAKLCGKLGLQFIELNACPGGCVGGALTVENPYISQTQK